LKAALTAFLAAAILCLVGCGANSSISEEDALAKQKKIDEATKKLYPDGEIPADEKRD
jgi:hypothetical protein